MRTYDPMPGEDISGTAAAMVKLAQFSGEPVTAEFNGIPLDAAPTSKAEDICAGYFAECKRRHDAYVASPEYVQSQKDAEDARKRKREQQSSLLAKAPPTLTLRDPMGWKKSVNINKHDPYGNAVTVFADKWARIMEAQMGMGQTLAECAESASGLADDDGITGFMYGCAVSILSQVWVHGEELRRWHNLNTQIKDEGERANETGSVLNPALLSLG